ncbi:MAG: ParA family protein [Terricaulis sp.]|nr:ParA family protein [Terricaulis sp.]
MAIALNNGRPIVIVLAADLPPGGWIESTLDLEHAIDLRAGDNASAETLGKITEAARGVRGQGRVIAMLNIKGGVGKTVLAANLFAAAHLADKRSISFIDLDPQHNLTQYFLSPGERARVR